MEGRVMTRTIQEFLDDRRKAGDNKREKRRKKEAERRVQLCEFGGKICLCLDSIPLVPIEDGSTDLLNIARSIFRDWLEKTKQ